MIKKLIELNIIRKHTSFAVVIFIAIIDILVSIIVVIIVLRYIKRDNLFLFNLINYLKTIFVVHFSIY